MDQSYTVWEHSDAPRPGPALTFHRWRNNLMRFIPAIGIPVLILSLIFISDLALLILQAIAEGLALIYIVPSILISQHDGDSAYDMVIVEGVFTTVASGLWIGSIVRLQTMRSWSRTCSNPYDRVVPISFGRSSDIQCTFSIVTIVGSSVLLAACIIWLLVLLMAMRITPGKKFGQTWNMAAHRLARGHEVGAVDLYEDTAAQREIQEYHSTVQPFTGGLGTQRESQRQSGHRGQSVVSQADDPNEPPPAYKPTSGTAVRDWSAGESSNNVVRQL